MIKRLHGRRSAGTLVANPRRKRKSKSKRGVRALFANPRKKRHSAKRRNPHSLSGHIKNARRRRSSKRRNPQFNLGIDLVSVGIGSVAAIALSSVGQGVFDKYLANSLSAVPAPVRDAVPSLLVAGAAWATNKYVKNTKVKEIAKITMVLAVYKAIDDAVGGTIKKSVTDMLPGATSSGSFGGAYIPALKGMTGGAYLDATGGAYMHTAGLIPSANLYGL